MDGTARKACSVGSSSRRAKSKPRSTPRARCRRRRLWQNRRDTRVNVAEACSQSSPLCASAERVEKILLGGGMSGP